MSIINPILTKAGGVGYMTTSLYDPNSIGGDVFDMDNMTEGSTNKLVSGTEKTSWNGKMDSPTVTSIASSATPTPTGGGKENEYYLTALAVAATFAAPSGTPANGNTLLIRIKDTGTSKNLSWNAIYREIGTELPSKTTANKTIYIGGIYNSTDGKWDITSVIEEE